MEAVFGDQYFDLLHAPWTVFLVISIVVSVFFGITYEFVETEEEKKKKEKKRKQNTKSSDSGPALNIFGASLGAGVVAWMFWGVIVGIGASFSTSKTIGEYPMVEMGFVAWGATWALLLPVVLLRVRHNNSKVLAIVVAQAAQRFDSLTASELPAVHAERVREIDKEKRKSVRRAAKTVPSLVDTLEVEMNQHRVQERNVSAARTQFDQRRNDRFAPLFSDLANRIEAEFKKPIAESSQTLPPMVEDFVQRVQLKETEDRATGLQTLGVDIGQQAGREYRAGNYDVAHALYVKARRELQDALKESQDNQLSQSLASDIKEITINALQIDSMKQDEEAKEAAALCDAGNYQEAKEKYSTILSNLAIISMESRKVGATSVTEIADKNAQRLQTDGYHKANQGVMQDEVNGLSEQAKVLYEQGLSISKNPTLENSLWSARNPVRESLQKIEEALEIAKKLDTEHDRDVLLGLRQACHQLDDEIVEANSKGIDRVEADLQFAPVPTAAGRMSALGGYNVNGPTNGKVLPPDQQFPKVLLESNQFSSPTWEGSGGEGVVYRAVLNETGDTVAIKFLKSQEGESDTRKFIHEVSTWDRFSHYNNVVTLYSINLEPVPHMVMEYVPNSVYRMAKEGRRLGLGTAANIGYYISEVLKDAHYRRMVHNDLTGKNMLLTEDLQPRLADWGLSGDSGDVEGYTPRYASPEHLTFGAITEKSDIYQLGVVMYEALTTRVPFQDHLGTPKFDETVLTTVPVRPSEIVGPNEVGPLDDIVMRCLEKNPDDRPTATELHGLLRPVVFDYVDEMESRSAGSVAGTGFSRSRRFRDILSDADRIEDIYVLLESPAKDYLMMEEAGLHHMIPVLEEKVNEAKQQLYNEDGTRKVLLEGNVRRTLQPLAATMEIVSRGYGVQM